MRAFVPLWLVLTCVGCGQDIDHPASAASCDPATMRCTNATFVGGNGDGNSSSGGGAGGDAVTSLTGSVLGFSDDFFEQGQTFSKTADVSASGRGGARVTATYDGTSFQLNDVLKTSVNWFLTVPAAGSGFLPTLMPLDTRRATSEELRVGVASALQVEAILQNLGVAPSDARAQIVLRVVDAQGSSVTGVSADFSAEVVAYRSSGAWLANASTDESGLIFLGNAAVGSALSGAQVSLRGSATARIELQIVAGATTIVTAVVK